MLTRIKETYDKVPQQKESNERIKDKPVGMLGREDGGADLGAAGGTLFEAEDVLLGGWKRLEIFNHTSTNNNNT